MLTLAWRVAPWTAPLAAPLATGAGAIAMRSGWYLACAGGGHVGLGEVVPWPRWGTEAPEAVEAFLAAWPAACAAPADLAGVAAALGTMGLDPARTPALWAGAELALLDWLARRRGMPLAALLAAPGSPIAPAVPVAALIGADAPEAAAAAARAAVAAGHRVVKLKATGAADLARVAAVRAAIGPDVALRLDANEAWGADAGRLLAEVAPFAPAFVEQPVAGVDGLVPLLGGAVPVAADEALGRPGAVAAALAAGVPVLVVKPMVTGGLLAARDAVRAATAVGARVVLSSALDRGVGTAGALHLAAACPGLPAAGLGTAGWWADGGALAGLVPVEGAVAVPAGPGLGFGATDPMLMALLASADEVGEAGGPPPPGGRTAEARASARDEAGEGDRGTPDTEGAPLITPSLAPPSLPFGARAQVIDTDDTPVDLDARIPPRAAHLAAHGVRPGDVVALWGPNAADWVVTARAAWRLGATLLPLPPRWTDAEAGDLLGRVAPRLVVGPADLAARAAALGHPATPYAEADGPAPEAPLPPIAAIVPTSGTTGRPKLARLTSAGLAATADATAQVLDLREGDVYWLPLPLHHVGGLGALWRAWRAGAVLRLAPDGAGATHASLVPTQLLDLADRPWPAGLRAVMVGGAAPPADLAARCPAAWATYGLTEGGGTVTLSPAHAAAGTAGLPLPGWALAILDEAGDRVPDGQEGAIAVRGPGTMAGYLEDPEATARALTPDGWLRTGDLGRLDPAGRLEVLGRRDDLIVSGGENVYPAEVEAALRGHPAIADACVVAAPDARWGQVPVAFAVAHPRAAAPDLPALRGFLGDRLARFKHPHALTWLEALPRLASGKVDRRSLRDRAGAVRV